MSNQNRWPTERQITCCVCGKPVGQKGSMPAIKVAKGQYRHSDCHGNGQK